MKVKIKKLHPKAIIPEYAKEGDAGMDLVATEYEMQGIYITYKTGLAVEIPYGYVGLIFPRSSVYKKEQSLANSVGVIDSGYRGEIMLKYTTSIKHYLPGERIGQLLILPYPRINFEEVSSLSDTSRAGGGFGSTGD